MLYMHVNDLIIIAFNIVIYKHKKHAINNDMKACKNKRELEIDTKIDEGTSLFLQTKVVLPPNFP